MAFRNLTGQLTRLFRSDLPPPETLHSNGTTFKSSAALESEDRSAAIDEMVDGPELRRLAGLGTSPDTAAATDVEFMARARIAQLVDAGGVDFASLLGTAGTSDATLSIAALCVEPTHLAAIMASIDDPRRIVALVTGGSSSRVRQLAAHRIDDPAELKSLSKQLRGKDKSVYKIIKEKCDALRAEETRVAQLASDTEAACATLERLSHRLYDALYEASMRISLEQWQTLEAQAATTIVARAHAAVAACRAIVAEHARQIEERAAQQAGHAAEQAARLEAKARVELEAAQRREADALAAAELQQQRAAEAAVQAERATAKAAKLKQITGLIARTQAALRDGDTGHASGMRRALDDKLKDLGELPAHITRQVLQLDGKLGELKQWKDYAVAPKRAELIAEMEGLIGSTEAPQALSDRIKQLQEDWKTISKGVVSDSEEDWQRFHLASQSAYQPCREYFEAQSALRQTNLEARGRVLARVIAFETALDPEQPDWRAIATVLREAPQEFRRPTPVDRAAGRRLQDEFDTALGRLRARIDAWYTQNATQKQALIERAKGLLDKSDAREAVDGIKQLQQLWKNTGSVEHRDEQRLWEEFRAQCDAVFARRQQAFTEHAASLDANKAAAVALCEEVEQLSAVTGPALLQGTARISPWRDAFEGLGELPRAEQRTLQGRFERAIKQLQHRIAQQRARDEDESYLHLFEASRLIRAYGWCVATDRDSAERDASKAAAQHYVAAIATWPKGAAPALKQAWLVAEEATLADGAANEAALRLLCIRAEILNDRSTPAEDQSLRREYQVKRLMQRMGRGDEPPADDPQSLAMEWVRIGPLSDEAAATLLERFARARGSVR